ncbi:plasmid pRiA4b ORF-3 family protein [Salinicoccus sp. HZC-1]|uniref:plasmid pRiA4b ORF-3 family protein n=1 Tax=Salinicoccus sp. HZC-1 TaxID=3385497 RepID=UPI00398B21D4
MDLKDFFDHFLEENELVRANLMNEETFDSIEALAENKMKSISDGKTLAEVSGNVSMGEAALLRSLVDEETPDNLHHVPYDVSKYQALTDYQYILEAGDGEGVIHHDIVEAIDAALKSTGVLPAADMFIHRDEAFNPRDIGRLEQIYKGPIYWLYNNLTWRELKALLRRLGSETEGNQKDDYLRHITALVTSPQFLEEILLHIGDEEFEIIRENVDKDYNVYEAKSRWEEAKNLGLIVKVHANFLVMHQKVLETLKSVNFDAVAQRRKPQSAGTSIRGDYNAYALKLEVMDTHEPVWREVQVPAGMNFFELHLVIRAVMDWRSSSPSRFTADGYTIYESILLMKEEQEEDGNEAGLLASFTQIDALFDQTADIHYHYESVDGYTVKISITDRINIDHAIPAIRSYGGPIPIENVGGPEGLEKALAILNDSQHPDYARTYEKARTMNYRERYPMTAINNRLEKRFGKAHPVTEFNV